jgi:thiol:disulfide interchange protein DsbC
MPTAKQIGAALLLAWTSLAIAADPDEIALLERLKSRYPATQWSSVTRTPMAGVYEAMMGPNLAYVGSDGWHFLFGHLFDMRTQTDLTESKLAGPERISPNGTDARHTMIFAALPLTDAIKTVHGNGERVLAVFSDPNCPYCKLLEAELAKLENVTLYIFLLPWISPDRTAAEAAWAHAVPERAHDAAAVLGRNLSLATRVGLRGTPLLIAGDGRVSEGAKPATELEAWLDAGENKERATKPDPTTERTQ